MGGVQEYELIGFSNVIPMSPGRSQPQDQPQVFGKPRAYGGIDFEVTDPPVVVGAMLVNQSQIHQPLQPPADGRRRTKVEQEQALDRQRAPLLLVIADFDNKRIVDRGLKTREMPLFERLKSSNLLEHTPY